MFSYGKRRRKAIRGGARDHYDGLIHMEAIA